MTNKIHFIHFMTLTLGLFFQIVENVLYYLKIYYPEPKPRCKMQTKEEHARNLVQKFGARGQYISL
jgi:hypothetical protein